jgi:hypothetical protein
MADLILKFPEKFKTSELIDDEEFVKKLLKDHREQFQYYSERIRGEFYLQKYKSISTMFLMI